MVALILALVYVVFMVVEKNAELYPTFVSVLVPAKYFLMVFGAFNVPVCLCTTFYHTFKFDSDENAKQARVKRWMQEFYTSLFMTAFFILGTEAFIHATQKSTSFAEMPYNLVVVGGISLVVGLWINGKNNKLGMKHEMSNAEEARKTSEELIADLNKALRKIVK